MSGEWTPESCSGTKSCEHCAPFDGEATTREEWKLSVCDDGYPMVATAGDVIAIDEPNHHPGCRWSVARFRLIAAAPDLYHALSDMQLAMDAALLDPVFWRDDIGDIRNTARAALAKAEGREPSKEGA